MMTKITSLVLLFFMVLGYQAQLSEINNIKTRYTNWLTDNTISSYTPGMVSLLNRYTNGCTNAENYVNTNINFTAPGPVWNMTNSTDNGAAISLVRNQLFYLVMGYHLKGPLVNGQPSNTKYHNPNLKQLILKVFKYMKDKGISSTTNFNFIENPQQELLYTYNSGFGLRAHIYGACVFLMKNELVEAGEFSHHQGVLAKLTNFINPNNPNFHFTFPGFNADVIRALIETRLCYVLGQEDSESGKLANMEFLKNFSNHSLSVSNGWAGTIKPDFMTFHHMTAYPNSYGMDALNSMAIMNYILEESAYKLNATAKANLKAALFAYPKFCADYEIPRALTGRFPNSTGLGRTSFALLYATDPVSNLDAGKFYRRMPDNGSPAPLMGTFMQMKIAAEINNAVTPDTPIVQGHFGFPYGGINIHKYNGYHVAVKGTSNQIWSYENSAFENIFGRYNSAGSMEIFSAGTPKTRLSNGLGVAGTNGAVTDNGWDWAHLPGVTGALVPYTVMAAGTHRLFSGRSFLVHASLDDNEVFALDFKDAHSATPMSALKTVFFFKDKMLCLGSDIKDQGGTYPVHTTLFQTGLAAVTTPTYIDGNQQSGLDVNFSQSSGAHWATDAVGNGFVIPTGDLNGTLNIKRGTQQSRNQANTADTQGNYAIAYIDHGIAPSSGSYRYGVLLQGGSSGTQAFAQNFANYFNIIQQNSSAHVVKFVEDNIYNYVVFNPSSVFQADAVISLDKPAVVMTQKTNAGEKIKVSLTNPLNLLAANENYNFGQLANGLNPYRTSPVTPVKLTLAGNWQLENPANNVTTISSGGNTVVTFNTKDGKTIQATLVKAVVLGTSETENKNEMFTVYPNPSENIVHIALRNDSKENLKMYSMAGTDVTSGISVLKRQSKKLELNISKLIPGGYTLCLGNECKKIIKK
ncbi:chondroitinase family polysaccharide lyase [Chryseobacterium sp. JM1]|uniref:chondroitinase family polysaccharide lyase n=1 Tax=Chryseobacterium sp. JM1 TaxID=1233950 RepID=UPI00068FE0B4|nr:chondroitinase family polysaccharide lyase [Chryseobacterium sp. JM1]